MTRPSPLSRCRVQSLWRGRNLTDSYRSNHTDGWHANCCPPRRGTVLPGVGHHPMFDDPALVARTISRRTTGLRDNPAGLTIEGPGGAASVH